jgi:hypothetical protein
MSAAGMGLATSHQPLALLGLSASHHAKRPFSEMQYFHNHP